MILHMPALKTCLPSCTGAVMCSCLQLLDCPPVEMIPWYSQAVHPWKYLGYLQ